MQAHPNGYQKINLRNTPQPLGDLTQPGRTIGSQPFVHQIAIVAQGNGPLLRATAEGQGYEVSS